MWSACLILSLSAATAGTFLLGGIASRRERRRLRTRAGAEIRTAETDDGRADLLETQIRTILEQETPRAAGQFTRIEMAVQPGLVMNGDREAFRRALRLIVRDSLTRAESGHVLVTAARHGGRLRVVVADDGPAGERETQEGRLREAQELLALMGATFELEFARPDGRSVVMRLPEPGPLRTPIMKAQEEAPAGAPPLATVVLPVPTAGN